MAGHSSELSSTKQSAMQKGVRRPAVNGSLRGAWGAGLALLVALLPKCPFCWASYLSFMGLSAATWAPLHAALLPTLTVLFLVHVFALYKRSRRHENYLPVWCSALGFLGLVVSYQIELSGVRVVALLLILAGSMIDGLRSRASRAAKGDVPAQPLGPSPRCDSNPRPRFFRCL